VIATIVRLLRLASFVICVIVIASFVVFAVDQTKSASGRQQEELASGSPVTASSSGSKPSAATGRSHESSVHKAIDDASSGLTSPFSSLVSGSSSEWAERAFKLGLALLVYGFGLGYLARAIRVRV
jgi:hypothetical protein